MCPRFNLCLQLDVFRFPSRRLPSSPEGARYDPANNSQVAAQIVSTLTLHKGYVFQLRPQPAGS